MEKIASEYKIIIVDDEPLVTSTLKTLLTLETDYYPVTFNSPAKATEYLKESQADLIISDFFMPEMNGIEFLRIAKEFHPGASLVLLTGYADKESAIKAINEIGLYRYLEKPWDNQDLLLCIKNGLERSHLMENLEQKIDELSLAKEKLENYNEQLESIVKERTADLLKSNEELEKTNIKIGAIINYCADGIITVTKNGFITQVNPAFERISGIESQNIINKDFNSIFISENNSSICDELNPNLDILLRNYKLKRIDKKENIPVEISFAPIISINYDEVSHYVGVIRDITPQYEMDRLRDDFIATLTHDLRTPLLAAIQTLRFFLDRSLGDLSDKQNKFLSTMLISNQDMLGLVNALLEVYKYESGKLILCKELFSLKDFINKCSQELKCLIETKNINLIIEDFNDKNIYADKQELKRVHVNLLGNAISYTPSGGEIRIIVDYNNENVSVFVKDNGTGIPAEDVSKLFNRFSQGTSKKRSTGTGLGLYLSRQIIEAHSGKISLESELGKGSRFKYTIPVHLKE